MKLLNPSDELHATKKKDAFVIKDLQFETLKQFSKYFAHNNVDEVLTKINKIIYNKLKKRGKSHLFSVKTESEFVVPSPRKLVKNQMLNPSILKEDGGFNDWRNQLKNQKIERKKIEVKKKNLVKFLMDWVKMLFKNLKNKDK